MTRVKPVKTKHQIWTISHFNSQHYFREVDENDNEGNDPWQESFTVRAEICGHGAGEFEIWAWQFGPEDGKRGVDNDGQVATEVAGHGVRTLYLIEELCEQM